MSLRVGREHRADELGARPDAELAVDPGEVRLDRLDRYEQLVRDLAVRLAQRDGVGDTPLRGRERTAAPHTADPIQRGARTIGPARGADAVERRTCSGQRVPGGAFLLG